MDKWEKREIERILIQLDEMNFPFQKYAFTRKNERLHMLGKGGFALVYEAQSRNEHKNEFAIKVIGFKGKYLESQDFKQSVEAQKELGSFHNNVVKVYDYKELWVWLDEENNVIKAEKVKIDDENIPKGNCVKLQFIVMEKVVPVLSYNQSGTPQLAPAALASFDVKEIMKLACEIGDALARAHEKKLLHRDVKLENIFYKPKGKHYKLGDFGIAKVTDNGLASTSAFTKGYGAPEVTATLNEKYDNTADIYSFGTLLYVLLNGLRFPESDNYNVNINAQYRAGYIFPQPESAPDDFFQIVEKMCKFNPDDRYQSMDEVLNELDKIVIHEVVGFKKEHSTTTLVVGGAFLTIGTIACKQMYFPDFPVNLGLWTYVFLALLFWRMMMSLMKKDTLLLSIPVLGIGIYLMIQSGFSWWKLIVLLFVAFSEGVMAGILAIPVLFLNIIWIMSEHNFILPVISFDYQWIIILLLSLAAILLLEYMVINMEDLQVKRIYFTRNIYWISVYLIYVFCILYGITVDNGYHGFFAPTYALMEKLFGSNFLDVVRNFDLFEIGICGLVFSIIWSLRERVLMRKSDQV